jgi:hypothetical protein
MGLRRHAKSHGTKNPKSVPTHKDQMRTWTPWKAWVEGESCHSSLGSGHQIHDQTAIERNLCPACALLSAQKPTWIKSSVPQTCTTVTKRNAVHEKRFII